ncbi:MAG: hypothetical protein ACE5FL_03710 [Myxococcota bacterium]
MAIKFPSLDFFEALKKRTTEDVHTFEKLGYCDTSFGLRIGDTLYTVRFEVYECVEVSSGGDPTELDFVLAASESIWCEMIRNILESGGADAAHTLNTLSHLGDQMQIEYDDPEGHDRFYRFMASIQEFFDQARHLDVSAG